MAKQAEIVARLQAQADKIDKVITEVSGLKQEFEELKNNLPDDASPELVGAVERIESRLAALDDVIPDAEPPAPEEQPTT